MADVFSEALNWAAALSPFWVYLSLLAVSYGENVVPFIPGDLYIAFCGYLAGIGQINVVVAVVVASVGGTLGFMTMYGLGYRAGAAVLDPQRLRWIPKQQARRVEGWLQRYGYRIVALNRFLSGARSVISLTVGMARMSPTWVLVWSGLGATVWTVLIVVAGYKLGANWEVVGELLADYGRVVITLMVATAAFYLGRAWYRRRRRAAWQATLGGQDEANAPPKAAPVSDEADTPDAH
ncbi:MAG: DedA family protein [Bacteroidota bacterium]